MKPQEVQDLCESFFARLRPDSSWPVFSNIAASAAKAKHILVLSVGKASVALARAMIQRLREIPGSREKWKSGDWRLVVTAPAHLVAEFDVRARVYFVDHPHSTHRNLTASSAVKAAIESLGPDDLLLVGLSGGTSAHLALPTPGVELQEMDSLYAALRAAGATIGELNTVRKHCGLLKGGRAAMLTKAHTEVYVVSDVIGDRLDVIGSGPFVGDPTTLADAIAIVKKYNAEAIAPTVMQRLADPAAETPKPGDPHLQRIPHRLVANNQRAIDEFCLLLELRGTPILEHKCKVEGDAATVGRQLARMAAGFVAAGKHGAIVFGGEPTVDARKSPKGAKGGPSQELALASVIELDRLDANGVTILAISTDGVDGESEFAGAFGTRQICTKAAEAGTPASEYLARHDSAAFWSHFGGAIRTGPSGTNLNHVAAAIF